MSLHRSFLVRPRLGRAATALGFAMLVGVVSGCTILATRPDVKIGAAAPTGTDYSLAASICRLFNLDAPRHHMRCMEEATSGSVANVDALQTGEIDIGIVQSDALADAAGGRAYFASSGPARDLRILFSGHDELLTVIARRSSGIRTMADLRGRHVSLGPPESRARTEAERVMTALGLAPGAYTDVRVAGPVERSRAFCSGEIDAIAYSVSHPSGLVRDLIRTCGGALVSVAGPEIDEVLAGHREYERGTIQGGLYANDPTEVHTFGVRAAVVATARMPAATAYEITKDVFENLEALRRLHPAFGGLTIADMIRPTGGVPIHAGALRYYRERGWISRATPDGK